MIGTYPWNEEHKAYKWQVSAEKKDFHKKWYANVNLNDSEFGIFSKLSSLVSIHHCLSGQNVSWS